MAILCSMTDLMGAIPVPGPIQMIGTSNFAGNLSNPFFIPICRIFPVRLKSLWKLLDKKPSLTWSERRNVRSADTFSRNFQLGSIFHNRYAEVNLSRVFLLHVGKIIRRMELMANLNRTSYWELSWAQRRKDVEDIVLRNFHMTEFC